MPAGWPSSDLKPMSATLESAKAAVRSHDWATALDCCRTGPGVESASYPLRCVEALCCVQLGRVDEAVTAYIAAVDDVGNSPEGTHAWKGLLNLRLSTDAKMVSDDRACEALGRLRVHDASAAIALCGEVVQRLNPLAAPIQAERFWNVLLPTRSTEEAVTLYGAKAAACDADGLLSLADAAMPKTELEDAALQANSALGAALRELRCERGGALTLVQQQSLLAADTAVFRLLERRLWEQQLGKGCMVVGVAGGMDRANGLVCEREESSPLDALFEELIVDGRASAADYDQATDELASGSKGEAELIADWMEAAGEGGSGGKGGAARLAEVKGACTYNRQAVQQWLLAHLQQMADELECGMEAGELLLRLQPVAEAQLAQRLASAFPLRHLPRMAVAIGGIEKLRPEIFTGESPPPSLPPPPPAGAVGIIAAQSSTAAGSVAASGALGKEELAAMENLLCDLLEKAEGGGGAG